LASVRASGIHAGHLCNTKHTKNRDQDKSSGRHVPPTLSHNTKRSLADRAPFLYSRPARIRLKPAAVGRWSSPDDSGLEQDGATKN
jgi:hypothetical protein